MRVEDLIRELEQLPAYWEVVIPAQPPDHACAGCTWLKHPDQCCVGHILSEHETVEVVEPFGRAAGGPTVVVIRS